MVHANPVFEHVIVVILYLFLVCTQTPTNPPSNLWDLLTFWQSIAAYHCDYLSHWWSLITIGIAVSCFPTLAFRKKAHVNNTSLWLSHALWEMLFKGLYIFIDFYIHHFTFINCKRITRLRGTAQDLKVAGPTRGGPNKRGWRWLAVEKT